MKYFTSKSAKSKAIGTIRAWFQQREARRPNLQVTEAMPTSFTEEVALFYDLMEAGIATDSTARDFHGIHGWPKATSGLVGGHQGYHDLSHLRPAIEIQATAASALSNNFILSQLRDFLEGQNVPARFA